MSLVIIRSNQNAPHRDRERVPRWRSFEALPVGRVSQYIRARRLLSEGVISDFTSPRSSRRRSAGQSDPWLVLRPSFDICRSRCEMPQPWLGPASRLRSSGNRACREATMIFSAVLSTYEEYMSRPIGGPEDGCALARPQCVSVTARPTPADEVFFSSFNGLPNVQLKPSNTPRICLARFEI